MSQGYCQRADLKKGNMNTNKGCRHFPDILANIHIDYQREIKGHFVTFSLFLSLPHSSNFLQEFLLKSYST